MSNEITVTYEGAMNAKFELPDSGTQAVGAPASCGGTGRGPSPKDLFVAGYASCVVMAMDVAAKKAGFDITGAKITVSPVWAKNEPILEEINAMLVLPHQYAEGQLDVLRKGERYCPIHNSLRPEVKTTLTFQAA
jgi:uncharacterized OsmC-like protein